MKIKDILAKGQPTLSFEVFPPKEESNFASVEKAALEIAKLNPSFMSVTYGAGGGTSQYTVQIASDIQSTCQVPALSHLTCVSSTREKVHSVLREIQTHGIENVLALRGDIPKDGKVEKDYQYASQLIREIRETCPDLCIYYLVQFLALAENHLLPQPKAVQILKSIFYKISNFLLRQKLRTPLLQNPHHTVSRFLRCFSCQNGISGIDLIPAFPIVENPLQFFLCMTLNNRTVRVIFDSLIADCKFLLQINDDSITLPYNQCI